MDRAAASASAPTPTAVPPSRVAGQPTPAMVTAAAARGLREATSKPIASVNPKMALSTSACISRFGVGSNGRKTS